MNTLRSTYPEFSHFAAKIWLCLNKYMHGKLIIYFFAKVLLAIMVTCIRWQPPYNCSFLTLPAYFTLSWFPDRLY